MFSVYNKNSHVVPMARLQARYGTNCMSLQAAEFEQMRCNNKTRFILAVVAGKLKISNRKRADIEGQLVDDGYDKMPNRGATVRSLAMLTA